MSMREQVERALLAELYRQFHEKRIREIWVGLDREHSRGMSIRLQGWISLGEAAEAIVKAIREKETTE